MKKIMYIKNCKGVELLQQGGTMSGTIPEQERNSVPLTLV